MTSAPRSEPVDGLEALEAAAVELAAEAGRILLDFYSKPLSVEYKDEQRNDPVTQADREIEQRLTDGIRSRFPQHAVLGEEGAPGQAGAEFLWVIDPLDGTSNFACRLPFFCISMAVLHHGEPVVAAIFAPGPSELGGGVYHARRRGGSYLGDRRLRVAEGEWGPVRGLASMPGFADRRFSMTGRFGSGTGDPRTLGSAALELALVAAGVLQYGLFGPLRIWDVAAGVLLVQEAGGEVLVWRGWPRGWRRFGDFESGRSSEQDPTGLRGWSLPLLAGGPTVTTFARSGVRPVGNWLSRLTRRLRRAIGCARSQPPGLQRGA